MAPTRRKTVLSREAVPSAPPGLGSASAAVAVLPADAPTADLRVGDPGVEGTRRRSARRTRWVGMRRRCRDRAPARARRGRPSSAGCLRAARRSAAPVAGGPRDGSRSRPSRRGSRSGRRRRPSPSSGSRRSRRRRGGRRRRARLSRPRCRGSRGAGRPRTGPGSSARPTGAPRGSPRSPCRRRSRPGPARRRGGSRPRAGRGRWRAPGLRAVPSRPSRPAPSSVGDPEQARRAAPPQTMTTLSAPRSASAIGAASLSASWRSASSRSARKPAEPPGV